MVQMNVSRVLKNKRFAQNFTVYRKTGSWIAGRFVETEVPIVMLGVVTAGGTKDIIQVPEADRTSGLMVFHSTDPIFVTHNDPANKGTSDEIVWNNVRYRVSKVLQWSDFGYYKAYAVSSGGE